MRDIIRYAWYQQLFSIYKSVNGLFYYLRKIPFLGKYIPSTIFRFYTFKTALFWIFGFFSILLRIVGKCIWLSTYVFLANVGINLVNGSSPLASFHEVAFLLDFLIWVCFVGLILHFGKALDKTIVKPERDFVQSFGLSWNLYSKTQAFVAPLLTSIFYLPALLMLSLFAQNILYLLVGLTVIPAWDLAGSALKRYLYQIGKVPNVFFSFLWALSSFAIIFIMVYHYTYLDNLYLLGLLILQMVILVISYRYVDTFEDVGGFIAYFLEGSTEFDKKLFELTKGNEYTRQGLAMQKKLTLKKTKDLSHLSGMTYINALLFHRYRSILVRQFIWRISGILIVWVLGQIIMSYSEVQVGNKELLAIMPYLFIVMYALSLSRAMAQMVFVNCDVAMLHYPFYRKGKNILIGFNYRWLQSFKYNVCFALGIFFLLLSWGHLSYSPTITALLALLLLSLTALLSFHDLFIYYVLQPFTKDMEVVNSVYKILSSGLYWVAYFNTQFDINSTIYVYIISALLLLYVGIGYLLLLKMAPKTFVLKQ